MYYLRKQHSGRVPRASIIYLYTIPSLLHAVGAAMSFLDRLCVDAAKSELEPKNTSAGFFYLVTFLQPVFILMVCSMLPGNSAGYDVWNSYHTIAALCYLPHWLGYAYSECSGSDKWFVLILGLIGT